MSRKGFFAGQKEQSLVKATIAAKYFDVWARIITNTQKSNAKSGKRSENRIAYIDLFAGPGRYQDGSSSTPVMILESAIQNPDLCERLVTIFNDKDENSVNSLRQTIQNIKGIEKLKYQPIIHNSEVGQEIMKIFESRKLIPTLFFVDPWGYKGLSLRLLNSVLKDWGCDAIFFFNFNRIHPGITNPKVEPHMRALFENQFDPLVETLKSLKSEEHEGQIVESICQAIKESRTSYTLPFCFKDDKGRRTKHHLIFVSKHLKGYNEMKKIMHKESSNHIDGVASFEYNPRSRQQLLFPLSTPLDELEDDLLRTYRGTTIGFKKLYEKHSIGKPFILNNYKKVLRAMYDNGKITAVGENGKPPRKGTFAEHMTITFPE